VTAAGLLFTVWARRHLGRNWSGTVTIKADHEMIDTGPYRGCRHPIYTRLLIAFAGNVLAVAEVRGLLAFCDCVRGPVAQAQARRAPYARAVWTDVRRLFSVPLPLVRPLVLLEDEYRRRYLDTVHHRSTIVEPGEERLHVLWESERRFCQRIEMRDFGHCQRQVK
jgi:hypothetical protein